MTRRHRVFISRLVPSARETSEGDPMTTIAPRSHRRDRRGTGPAAVSGLGRDPRGRCHRHPASPRASTTRGSRSCRARATSTRASRTAALPRRRHASPIGYERSPAPRASSSRTASTCAAGSRERTTDWYTQDAARERLVLRREHRGARPSTATSRAPRARGRPASTVPRRDLHAGAPARRAVRPAGVLQGPGGGPLQGDRPASPR